LGIFLILCSRLLIPFGLIAASLALIGTGWGGVLLVALIIVGWSFRLDKPCREWLVRHAAAPLARKMAARKAPL
jgi:hypothetical protein